jgi:hypothetical protein
MRSCAPRHSSSGTIRSVGASVTIQSDSGVLTLNFRPRRGFPPRFAVDEPAPVQLAKHQLADARHRPSFAGGAGDAIGVEALGDLGVASALGDLPKDAPDHVGLGLDNLALTLR